MVEESPSHLGKYQITLFSTTINHSTLPIQSKREITTQSTFSSPSENKKNPTCVTSPLHYCTSRFQFLPIFLFTAFSWYVFLLVSLADFFLNLRNPQFVLFCFFWLTHQDIHCLVTQIDPSIPCSENFIFFLFICTWVVRGLWWVVSGGFLE